MRSLLSETLYLVRDVVWGGIQTALFWIADDLMNADGDQ